MAIDHPPPGVPEPVDPVPSLAREQRGSLRSALAFVRSEPGLTAGLIVVLFWAVVATTIHLWAPFDPVSYQRMEARLQPPDMTHWFGTDNLGRDYFTRVMYGGRLSLPIALSAVAIATTVGCTIGAISGFVGRWLDEFLMRVSDVVLSLPAIVLALAISAALGPSSRNVVIAIAAVTWPEYARLMRGQVLSIRGNLHVTAAQSVGCGRGRIFWRHVLPFGVPPIVVKMTVDLGMAILLAAGLSFIGVGSPPPAPEWGAMVSDARHLMDMWWLGLFPGLAILSVVLAFNFIGDSMRDRLDPYMRAQRGRKPRSLSQGLKRMFLGNLSRGNQ